MGIHVSAGYLGRLKETRCRALGLDSSTGVNGENSVPRENLYALERFRTSAAVCCVFKGFNPPLFALKR